MIKRIPLILYKRLLMNLFNYFWCFKSALTPKFCDEVIKYALAQKETMALTGGSTEG